MMPYAPLGARPVVAAPDTTGQNVGNWTATLDNSVINSAVPFFEMYHLYIESSLQATGTQTSARVMLNSNFWDATLVGQLNSWDPSQPMLVQPGDIISVLFNIPITETPAPIVHAWFRFDTALAANRATV